MPPLRNPLKESLLVTAFILISFAAALLVGIKVFG
jgi:hypothetical protein